MARAERSGAGAFLVSPLGGDEVRPGAAPGRARCRADGGPEHRLATQQEAGAVQRRRGISRCTDQSAGGRADRCPCSITRAQACGSWTPRRQRLGAVRRGAAMDDGGVDRMARSTERLYHSWPWAQQLDARPAPAAWGSRGGGRR
jgi:hypothetical protein